MKKRTAFIGVILSFTSIIFFTGHVKSEEYICSSELSALGRPGEVELGKYQRIGNYFVQTSKNGKFKFSILKETSKFIVLAETYDYPDVFITILDKQKGTLYERYLSITEGSKESMPTMGTCIVSD